MASYFHALRADIDRMLSVFRLSQDDVKRTLLSETHDGGVDAEPHEGTERELLTGDEGECGASALSEVRTRGGSCEGQR